MTAPLQFDRGARVTVVPPIPVGGEPLPPFVINPIVPLGAGVPSVPQLRVRFRVDQSMTLEPQRATINVWNLAKTTRDAIAGASRRVVDWIPGGVPSPLVSIDGRIVPGDPIVTDTAGGIAHALLEVGYSGALGVIFGGSCAPVINDRQAPDWITTMQAGDSELALSQGVANKSFAPGTPGSVVMQYLATVCGLRVVPTTAGFQSLAGYILTNGIVADGRARDGIRDIAEAMRLSAFALSGELWLLSEFETIPGPPVVCSPEPIPGLLRILQAPKRIDGDGIEILTQLSTMMKPGIRVVVTSSEVAGVYRCEHVTHTGDNRGGPWHSAAVLRTQSPLGL